MWICVSHPGPTLRLALAWCGVRNIALFWNTSCVHAHHAAHVCDTVDPADFVMFLRARVAGAGIRYRSPRERLQDFNDGRGPADSRRRRR